MPTVDKSVCELLARLAVAGTAHEVASALGRWIDEGRLCAIAVWSLRSVEGPLVPLYAQGIDEAVVEWNVLPRTERSPLWKAIDHGSQAWLEPLPEDLESTGVPFWHVLVLHDADRQPVGVALCGCDRQELPEGTDIVAQVLGPALARARHADAHEVRSELFRHVVELVDDGIIVATPDGSIPTYSPSLEKLTGWTRADIDAHGWTHLVYPDPAVRDETQRSIAALLRGAPSEGVVRNLVRKDGTEVATAIWSRLVAQPSGQTPVMLGVMRDVTTERMARRRAIWEESHAQLGRLAGGIAHEFNNLLAAIMGHADIIVMRSGDDDIGSHARTILRSAERGADLSRQLLAFSGSGNTRTDAIALEHVVSQAVELFGPRLGPEVTLSTRVEPGLPPVEADASQLQQVLINLLVNAADAVGESGSIEVSGDLAPVPGSVRYRSPHAPGREFELARLRVRDDGPGFGTDALANLFVPFYSGKAHGHGVGLPAVRGIVGAHGGAIDVQNDGGAVVDIYLPLSTRPELALSSLTADAPGSGERVWVIDDQVAILEFTRISLESRGFEVRTFDSVAGLRSALGRLMPEDAPAVVVIDVVMADGGGAAVFDALERAGLSPAVVWTSGYTPEDVRLPDAGALFLQKPFTGADLAGLVHRALE